MRKLPPVDLLFESVFQVSDGEPDTDDAQPDYLEKFREDAKLAGALGRGGFQRVENLKAEDAQLDARLRESYRKRAEQRAQADLEWKEQVSGAKLEKRARVGLIRKGVGAVRTETTASGWTFEYDSRGELIRGYAAD